MSGAGSPARVAPWIGRWIYRVAPIRRGLILANLRRAFGEVASPAEIERLAEAHYAHLARLAWEFLRQPFLSAAKQAELVRVENVEAILAASARKKGVLVLSGHFGNWEVATTLGIARFPEFQGRLHVVRRMLRPAALDRLVTGRFRRAGFGLLPKRGSLDAILDRLAANDAVIFVLDQHAGGRDGVAVDFFGHRAWTFRSLAVLAMASGAPVVPVASWREADGRHVLRFEDALPTIDDEDASAAIRANTQAYNDALEKMVVRHPEQWIWIHRRWKEH